MKNFFLLTLLVLPGVVFAQARLNGNDLTLSDGTKVSVGSMLAVQQPSKGNRFAYIYNEISLRASSEDDLPTGVGASLAGKSIKIKHFWQRKTANGPKFYAIVSGGTFINNAIDIESAMRSREVSYDPNQETALDNSGNGKYKQNQNGYNQNGYGQNGYNQGGSNQGSNQNGYGQTNGYQNGGTQNGYNQNGNSNGPSGNSLAFSNGSRSSLGVAPSTSAGHLMRRPWDNTPTTPAVVQTKPAANKPLTAAAKKDSAAIKDSISGSGQRFSKAFKKSDSVSGVKTAPAFAGKEKIDSATAIKVMTADPAKGADVTAVAPAVKPTEVRNADYAAKSSSDADKSGSSTDNIKTDNLAVPVPAHSISSMMTLPTAEALKPAEKPAETTSANTGTAGYTKYTKLKQLKELLDAGVLSRAEFDVEKKKILSSN